MWTIARWAVGIAAAGALAVAAATPAAAAGPGLLGQWRFDEPGGQVVADDGPQRLDGTLGATGTPDAADPARIAGAAGGGLRFDGASFVRLPDSAALAVPTLTAEAVVRAGTSPGAYRYVVSRGGRSCVAGSYGLYSGAAGGVALYVFDGTRYVVSASARPADVWNGAWHHVAGTFDGRALRLYVDGRPVGEPMSAPLAIDYGSTSAHASLGQYAGDCALSFRGDMDLVRLWAGARTASEIGDAAATSVGAPAGSGPLPAAAPGTTIAGTAAPAPAPGKRSSRRRCKVKLVGTRVRRQAHGRAGGRDARRAGRVRRQGGRASHQRTEDRGGADERGRACVARLRCAARARAHRGARAAGLCRGRPAPARVLARPEAAGRFGSAADPGQQWDRRRDPLRRPCGRRSRRSSVRLTTARSSRDRAARRRGRSRACRSGRGGASRSRPGSSGRP